MAFARRLPSDSSMDSSQDLSMEGSVTSTVEEPDTYHIPKKFPYIDTISRFIKIKQDSKYDMKPSWDKMNVDYISKNKLDMEILADRLRLLAQNARTLAQIETALPLLIDNDGELLRKWMPIKDANFVIKCMKKVEEDTKKDQTLRVDKCTRHIFRILSMNKCLPLYVEKYPPQIPHLYRAILDGLDEFVFYAAKHVEYTAAGMVQKEKKMRALFEMMHQRRVELKRLKRTVDASMREFNNRMNRKLAQIAERQQELDDTLEMFRKLEAACLLKSDKYLYQTGEVSVALQEVLTDDAITARTTYVNTLDAHLNEERMLRSRKIKTEAQLKMWLTKYDGDVGEKQHILDEMTEGFERENLEFQELECLMVEQETVYLRLIDEEQNRALDDIKDKLHAIAIKIAARILQKHWRSYLKRKLARKSSKMNKRKRGKEAKKVRASVE